MSEKKGDSSWSKTTPDSVAPNDANADDTVMPDDIALWTLAGSPIREAVSQHGENPYPDLPTDLSDPETLMRLAEVAEQGEEDVSREPGIGDAAARLALRALSNNDAAPLAVLSATARAAESIDDTLRERMVARAQSLTPVPHRATGRETARARRGETSSGTSWIERLVSALTPASGFVTACLVLVALGYGGFSMGQQTFTAANPQIAAVDSELLEASDAFFDLDETDTGLLSMGGVL
ncbi:MAG: hypothetical protein AAF220_08500 [Pseudomonadota bacterium]